MARTLNRIFLSRFGWVLLLLLLFAVNFLASTFHTRIDLTKEKRYTVSNATRNLLSQLDSDVRIDVFLKGEFPSGFRKLANSTDEFLKLWKERRGSNIHYRFISPQESIPGTRVTYADTLKALGATSINLTVQKEAGQNTNIIFPVAVMTYKGKSTLVNIYPGASRAITQVEINGAEAMMEYQFTNALSKLMNDRKPGIAYNIGNGEPVDGRTYDIRETLANDYLFRTLNLQTIAAVPDEVDLLMIVKPTIPFTEEEKFKIYQFVMRGGKLLCFIDNLIAEQDSLAFKPELIAYDRNLNLSELFFRYGLRINTDLVMDLQCESIPFIVGGTTDNPQYEFLGWNYFPLLVPAGNGSFAKNLNYIGGRFANSIDTINVQGVRKTFLLVSSPNSRIISTPALISLNENKNAPQDIRYNKNAIPVAVMLEGKFTSLYNNRVTATQQADLAKLQREFISTSVPNQVIVVADGDIVLNDFIPDPGTEPIPLPMGWNKYTYGEYEKQSQYGRLFIPVANREFLIGSIEQLVNNPDIIALRNKDIVLRLLDSKKIKDQRSTWQFIAIGLPVLLVLLFGWLYQQLRKRKYAS